MCEHCFQILAFWLIAFCIRHSHELISVEGVPFYDFFKESGGVLCQTDNFAVILLIQDIVRKQFFVFKSVNILGIPQIKALQILEIHACIAVDILGMVAVFADSQLKCIFGKRFGVACPCVFAISFIKKPVPFKHGSIPNTIYLVYGMDGSINIGNGFVAPFL